MQFWFACSLDVFSPVYRITPMRRVFGVAMAVASRDSKIGGVSRLACPELVGPSFVSSGPSPSTAPAPMLSFTVTQRRGLKNLHRNPTARYKSLVKDTQKFSHRWRLDGGREFRETSGHEREATENFAVYATDRVTDATRYTVGDPEALPPMHRLAVIKHEMETRWRVKDRGTGYDKARLALAAVECFADLKRSGTVRESLTELGSEYQQEFEDMAKAACVIASRASGRHPDAVLVLVRCADIADYLRMPAVRDRALSYARQAANGIGQHDLLGPEDRELDARRVVDEAPANVGLEFAQRRALSNNARMLDSLRLGFPTKSVLSSSPFPKYIRPGTDNPESQRGSLLALSGAAQNRGEP